MSLETLLEAAKYLEYRTEAKARGEEPHDYGTYARLSNGGPTTTTSGLHYSPESPENTSDDLKERRRALGAGTREVHNKLEKNRRAHLKECFDTLKKQIPSMDDKKTSNLSILRSALRYIQTLKRKEREYEHEMERLAREKIAQQQRLATLKKDLVFLHPESVDVHLLYPPELDVHNDSNSTSTASECGPLTEDEDEKPDIATMSSQATTLTSSSSSSSPHASTAPMATTAPKMHPVKVEPIMPAPTLPSVVIPPARPSISVSPRTTVSFAAYTTTPTAHAVSVAAQSLQSLNPALQVPTSNLQSFAASKATATITVNSLTPHTLAQQATHLQIPAQVVSHHHGLHMNGGTSVITHPTTVQVITPQGVRVISAAPCSSSSISNAMPPMMNTSASLVTSAPTFATTVNVVTPKMAANIAVPTVGKATNMPTMTLTKPNLLPVTMATLVTQPNTSLITQAFPQAKGIISAGPKTIPVTVAQLAVKAGSIPTLNLPTTLATLTRTVTLQTSSAPTQGIMSLTGVSGPALQVTNANVKPGTQILQQTLGQRAVLPHTVHTHPSHGNLSSPHLNNLQRQIVTTVKPMAQMRSSHLAQIAHVMQPTPIASMGQLVASGPGMTPLMASVMNHTAVAQVLTPQQISKMAVATASPILKSVGQIPLVPTQYLPQSQPLVKPMVMVTAPSVVTSAVTSVPQAMAQTTQVALPNSH